MSPLSIRTMHTNVEYVITDALPRSSGETSTGGFPSLVPCSQAVNRSGGLRIPQSGRTGSSRHAGCGPEHIARRSGRDDIAVHTKYGRWSRSRMSVSALAAYGFNWTVACSEGQLNSSNSRARAVHIEAHKLSGTDVGTKVEGERGVISNGWTMSCKWP